MKPGDLCEVKIDFLNEKHDFVGIYLGITNKNYPWYNFQFLHDSVVKSIILMSTEAKKNIKVLCEAR